MPDLGFTDLTIVLIFGLVSILLIVYSIALLANGFKTATNVKKWHHWLLFTLALIIGEIISKRIITHIL